MKNLIVKCPVCSEEMEWVRFPDHLESNGDDAHNELFRQLERQRDDAYFDAEYEFCENFDKGAD